MQYLLLIYGNEAHFSKLSNAERDAVDFACTTAKLTQGPGAYNECLAKQMSVLKKRKQ